MSLDEIDYEDSTEHLYDVVVATDGIDEQEVNQQIKAQVAQVVNYLFNNKEEVAEQMRQAADTDGE